jgi:hypothetical protein
VVAISHRVLLAHSTASSRLQHDVDVGSTGGRHPSCMFQGRRHVSWCMLYAGRGGVRHGPVRPDYFHFRRHHAADSAAAAPHARAHPLGRANHSRGKKPCVHTCSTGLGGFSTICLILLISRLFFGVEGWRWVLWDCVWMDDTVGADGARRSNRRPFVRRAHAHTRARTHARERTHTHAAGPKPTAARH